jgi:hypothetical protein
MGNKNDSKEEYIEYRKKFTLDERKNEFKIFKEKFKDKVPIIIEKLIFKPKDRKNALILKEKANREDTFGLLYSVLENKIPSEKDKGSLLLFINSKKSITHDQLIGEVYDKYKEEDGFLYVQYNFGLLWG